MIEAIDAHANFSPVISWSINLLLSGVDELVSDTAVAISSISSSTILSPTYSNQTVAFNQNINTTSDVFYLTYYQSFSIVENNTINITPDLPWSYSGSTYISFSLGAYQSSIIPSWIIINSSTGLLSITSPEVEKDTNFIFFINSSVNGVSGYVKKLVNITIKKWIALNWLKCSGSSNLEWTKCDSGYSQNSGTWSKFYRFKLNKFIEKDLSSTIYAINNMTISLISSTSLITIITSLMNKAAMASLWSMINQLQIFYLLLLTRAYFPDDVKSVIKGMKIALCFYIYIPIKRIEVYKSFLSNFNFELIDLLLSSVEINSNSTIFNTDPFLVLLALTVSFHLCIFLLNIYFLRGAEEESRKWWTKWWKLLASRIYNFMTFGYHIRHLLEISQYFLISSLYEIYYFNASSSFRQTSLIFSFGVVMIFLIIILFVLYLSLSSYKIQKLFKIYLHNIINFILKVKACINRILNNWILSMNLDL